MALQRSLLQIDKASLLETFIRNFRYNLPIFTYNETITNLTQYELSHEESDLLKAGLYFNPTR